MLKKKVASTLFAMVTILALSPISAFGAATIHAEPTSSSALLNGEKVSFEAYNINDNNFFKLRDLAKALNVGAKQFEVTWDVTKNAVNILTNHSYTPVGGELILSGNISMKNTMLTTAKVYLNGTEKPMTAYNINGNNYFKLRDIGTIINFGVAYDSISKMIIINTESIVYNNSQYGFKFTLPKSWENYSIVTEKWEGMALAGAGSGTIIETGPKISIRHPKWTSQAPRQDIPIMIFTLAQWGKLRNAEFSVGAGPIPPSELGRNAEYVFALPARYNFAFPVGFEEVESILENKPLQAF